MVRFLILEKVSAEGDFKVTIESSTESSFGVGTTQWVDMRIAGKYSNTKDFPNEYFYGKRFECDFLNPYISIANGIQEVVNDR